jgi:predicted RNA methylase
MKSGEKNPDKELYRQLRGLTCEQLWHDEVPRFDRASPKERLARVSVIRAVGVVFSETGTATERERVRPWLSKLLHDPNEKIRRYAMAALPKVGAGEGEETELLSLLRSPKGEREQKSLSRTLAKIGGAATLQELAKGPATGDLLQLAVQKIKASVARREHPSSLRMDAALSDAAGLRIHLRGRRGLEKIVRAEVEEYIKRHGKFRFAGISEGLVALTPIAPFSLADLFALRCFGSVGFVLGTVSSNTGIGAIEAMSAVITSALSRRILETLTEGSLRYRLEFLSRGFPKDAVQRLASRAYARQPKILNDSTEAPWTISVFPARHEHSVELSPNVSPDPRLFYRLQDIPAASHPPLAASMAYLAGRVENDVVWDPFCGSGLELVERALRGGVREIHGTDRNPDAVEIARRNFAAAKVKDVQAHFTCCDFHDFIQSPGLGPETVNLVITNPPMGRRVRVDDLRVIIKDLFTVATTVLKPGGRLVFTNPFHTETPLGGLKLLHRDTVDMGGFECGLEKYVKLAR